MLIRTTCLLVITTLLPLAAQVVGWRGDGTSRFPDQHPPLQWDAETGKNIRWRTLMPNWSNSSPIVVGDKVFVTSEPTDWAPILICCDADSGEILWQRELDHLDHLLGSQAAEARKTWSAALERFRELNRLYAGRNSLAEREAAGEDVAAAVAQLEQRAAALECTFKHHDRRKKGKDRPWTVEQRDKSHADQVKRCARDFGLITLGWNLGIENYHGCLTWLGYGYPTPVSDGERVYVWTAYNAVFAFDLNGRPQWVQHLGKLERSVGCAFATNPVLADGILVCAQAEGSRNKKTPQHITALDTATGKIRWQQQLAGFSIHSPHSPQVLQIDDTQYVYHSDGTLYRLADGKPMVTGLGKSSKGNGSAVKHGDCVFFNVGGDGALGKGVRFHAEGEGIRAEILFEKEGCMVAPRGETPVIWQDRLYTSRVTVDLATGKESRPVRAKSSRQAPNKRGKMDDEKAGNCVPWTLIADHHLIIGGAGGHYMNDRGGFWVIDLTTGKQIAENQLLNAPVSERGVDFYRGESATDEWKTFGNSAPFVAHDRIYFRSLDYLYCIGRR